MTVSCFTKRRYYDYVPLPSATKDRPLLWIGGMPLPWQIRDMHSKGVTAIVNMCEEFPGHESLYADLGIDQCWLPTTDYCNVTPEVIAKGVAFIHRKIQTGESVYVHCKSGIGRCAMVLVPYLAKHQHMSIEDANRWAREYRPALIGDVGKRPGVMKYLEKENNSAKIN
ncbi:hypothetical protein GUITHDRAFT_134914 [Guillardia theta CCMP2712]|uniref:Uncharacterized protein n=1 Tax=Guillardia theta (strain CCMP2712) TaxID=905079 RepID=L1JQH3_GUITC|nr:hypothetical protein GUITHDRAFT_134914 [Guillardia theta CCMP2712]EKX50801.1 hypothetical protein GUITHDRAFT_134914 [Guillardia theta CCMP2712]|eukprot:XP_005837781.1 hypothetical protein GUITHDRAFT_134914 [Guillardia theta CCMP2712]